MKTAALEVEKLLDLAARIFFVAALVLVVGTYVLTESYLRPLGPSSWMTYALLVFLAISLYSGTATRTNLFLAAFPIGLCLFAANAWLEYPYYDAATGQRVLSQLADSPEIDRRVSWQIIDDNRRNGEDIVVPICPSFVDLVSPGELMPLSGLPRRRTLLGNELGFVATFMSDRYGFNNSDEIYDTADAERTIVLLGDSYTQGFTVQPADNIAGHLNAGAARVFNLGCGGNGPLAELATYAEYGSTLHPDTVVFIYFAGNDLYDLAREWDSALRNYLDPAFSQRLLEREDARLDVLEMVAEARPQSRSVGVLHRLFTLRHLRNQANSIVRPRRFETEVARFQSVIETLQDRLKREAVDLLVVYLPHGPTMARETQSDCQVHPARCKSEILEVLQDLDIRVLDFEHALRTLDDPFTMFPFHRGNEVLGHLNRDGYELLAARIEEEIAAMTHD